MAKIYAGTAFNQVIHLDPSNKNKKTVFGAMNREPIVQICHNSNLDLTMYISNKSLYSIKKGISSQDAQVRLECVPKIIYTTIVEASRQIIYALSTGDIVSFPIPKTQLQSKKFKRVFAGEHPKSSFVGGVHLEQEPKCLLFGKNMPILIDTTLQTILWRGKNVKHDHLDLQVPINDVSACFNQKGTHINVLNHNNKLRLFDLRGTQRRPISDIEIKGVAPRSQMTKLTVDKYDENYFYVGNDLGEIFQLDSRKDVQISGKYKGITTSITGLSVGAGQLVSSSLDGYVRCYDLESRSLLKKNYLNKQLTSLFVDYQSCNKKEQIFIAEEVEQNLQQEEQQQKEESTKKVKFIRKRNKVGLKYLTPQQFDTPEEDMIKKEEEAVKKEEWYKELNPVDRHDFEYQ